MVLLQLCLKCYGFSLTSRASYTVGVEHLVVKHKMKCLIVEMSYQLVKREHLKYNVTFNYQMVSK